MSASSEFCIISWSNVCKVSCYFKRLLMILVSSWVFTVTLSSSQISWNLFISLDTALPWPARIERSLYVIWSRQQCLVWIGTINMSINEKERQAAFILVLVLKKLWTSPGRDVSTMSEAYNPRHIFYSNSNLKLRFSRRSFEFFKIHIELIPL